MSKQVYKIHFCLSGKKNKKEATYEFDSKREWEWEYEHLPYDIIDISDTEIWFDWGDE